jgi:flagellum-specific ATP synthase
MNDPIADQSRSILDGHIVLTRDLTEQGFYPPINLLKSASRVMDKVVNNEHYKQFLNLKRVLSLIKENEVLVRVGAYKEGMDKELDFALSKKEKIREFLVQDTQQQYTFEDITKLFKEVLS